jgi:DNA adenine methylase
MKSIFRYPGGKTKKSVQELIISHAPDSFSEYREPFVGGGGIFFAVKDLFPNVKYWINDIDKNLIEVYLALQTRPDNFIKLCQTIEPPKEGEPVTFTRDNGNGKAKYNERLKKVFDELKYNSKCDQALRYFFINRTVWAGRVNYDPEMESRMYFSNPNGWNLAHNNDIMYSAANLIKGTKITSIDFEELINKDGDDIWIYLDPPYIINTHMSDGSKLYANNFSMEDHKRLIALLKNCKHKFCLSYDDDEDGFIRENFKESEFYINSVSWTYSGTGGSKDNPISKKIGKELIITNYKVNNCKL